MPVTNCMSMGQFYSVSLELRWYYGNLILYSKMKTGTWQLVRANLI